MSGYLWSEIDRTLLPCPFCGGNAFAAPSGAAGAVIRCSQCSARTVSDVGFGKAVEDWNLRTRPMS